MSECIKAVIIGAGQIARQHLACLREIPEAEIAGVCDLSAAVAESTAERFGARAWFTDHRTMLTELRPDVVHITTPVTSHFVLAKDALNAGAHVIVEKPATAHFEDLLALKKLAEEKNLVLIEDYNCVFNEPVQRVLGLVRSGEFGEVTHVEAMICLNLLGKGSPFADPNMPHPSLKMEGGAISDFLPHLASLAYFFVGPHRSVRTVWTKRNPFSPLPSDEFRALIQAEKGTATLLFSAATQPDVFWLRVYGTKMRAAMNLYEPRLTIDRLRGGPKILTSFFNGLHEAKDVRNSAYAGLWRKLNGRPVIYEGLWELLIRTYKALSSHLEPPISLRQIEEVNRLIRDLKSRDHSV
jgi:predicted dehydrogenase